MQTLYKPNNDGAKSVFSASACFGGQIPADYPELFPRRVDGYFEGQVALGSVICSDGWKGYSGLVDLGYGNITGWIMAATKKSSKPTRLTSLEPIFAIP